MFCASASFHQVFIWKPETLTYNAHKLLWKSMNQFSKGHKHVQAIPEDVIFRNVGNKGIVTLNRPHAMNALNESMLSKLYPTLNAWQDEKTFIIMKGAGGKAFCSGGDVKSLISAQTKKKNLINDLIKNMYKTVALLGSYKIPYVAFMDGVVMGAGMGISVHGPYRVATERSVFAMPEGQIGLFPDTGWSAFGPKLEGKLGLFLGLTGYKLQGVDLLKAGIATHYVESKNLDILERDLLKVGERKDIEYVLAQHNRTEREFKLEPVLEKINYCFGAKSVEEIFERLKIDGSDWAQKIVKVLGKSSPTSLKVTFKLFEGNANRTLEEALQLEFRIVYNFVFKNEDFHEGVQALLIRKDHDPQWKPSKISNITSAQVESYFAKIPENDELII